MRTYIQMHSHNTCTHAQPVTLGRSHRELRALATALDAPIKEIESVGIIARIGQTNRGGLCLGQTNGGGLCVRYQLYSG